MLSLYFATILLALRGASADAELSFAQLSMENEDCVINCDMPLTIPGDDLKDCLASVVKRPGSDCESGHLEADYEVTDAELCPTSESGIFASLMEESAPVIKFPLKDLKEKTSEISSVFLERIVLAFTTAKPSQCGNGVTVNTVTGEDVCHGKEVTLPGDALLDVVDDRMEIQFSSSLSLPTSDGLIVKFNNINSGRCVVTSVPGAANFAILNGPVGVQPLITSLKDGSVTFNEGCEVEGCNEKFDDAQKVQVCLNNAAANEKCETAIYTRTIANVGTMQCSVPDDSLRHCMDIHEALQVEVGMKSVPDQTNLTAVYFSRLPAAKCGEPKLYMRAKCSANLEDPLQSMSQPTKGKLQFRGEQPVIKDKEEDRLIIFQMAVTKKTECTTTQDKNGDYLTFTSVFTINAHSASGSLGQVLFNWLVPLYVLAVTLL